MDAARLARGMHQLVELVHTPLYFARDVKEAFADLGLEPVAQGYVAGRAAPLGPVGPAVATAVFFNFSPALIALGVPGAWDIASPAEVLAARAAGLERLFSRVGAPSDDLAEATDLLREAGAAADLVGRPLAAGNAAVAAPGTPFADLWQALAVLREHRGDGHVALLTVAGVSPVEALAVYAAWQGRVSRRFLQRSRVWDDDAWETAEASLRDRGWLADDGTLTEAGETWRSEVERDTDRLAAGPWAALGEDRVRRLFDLLRPLAVALADGEDVFPRPPTVPERFPA